MGASVSAAKELKAAKNTELDQLVKILDAKREQFLAEVIEKRGGAISAKEVNGGRSIVRQSELRVSTSASPSSQIKDAIGSFFEAAQGGNKGKQAMIQGTTSLVSAGIDALFGVSAGQGMEKRGFVVLFLNFAFVRVDYYVYSYCVSGEKMGAKASVSGCVHVTDLCVLDPSTLMPSEIDYLIAQNVTIEPGEENEPEDEMKVVMQIKIMLSMSAALSRIIKNKETSFETLTKALDEIKSIQDRLKGEIEKLPNFKNMSELLAHPWTTKDREVKDFIENEEGLGCTLEEWNDYKEPKKRELIREFEEKYKEKNFKDLAEGYGASFSKITGYNKYDFDFGKAKTDKNGIIIDQFINNEDGTKEPKGDNEDASIETDSDAEVDEEGNES